MARHSQPRVSRFPSVRRSAVACAAAVPAGLLALGGVAVADTGAPVCHDNTVCAPVSADVPVNVHDVLVPINVPVTIHDVLGG